MVKIEISDDASVAIDLVVELSIIIDMPITREEIVHESIMTSVRQVKKIMEAKLNTM